MKAKTMSNYLDELHRLHRKPREKVEPSNLFYFRRSEGGGIEQVAVVDGRVYTKPISRKHALHQIKVLTGAILEGWTEDE